MSLLLALLAAAPSFPALPPGVSTVAEVTAQPPGVGARLDVAGFVRFIHRCTCPPGATCKPCPGPAIELVDQPAGPAPLTLRLVREVPEEVRAGRRVRVAGVISRDPSRPGLTLEAPSWTDLGVGISPDEVTRKPLPRGASSVAQTLASAPAPGSRLDVGGYLVGPCRPCAGASCMACQSATLELADHKDGSGSRLTLRLGAPASALIGSQVRVVGWVGPVVELPALDLRYARLDEFTFGTVGAPWPPLPLEGTRSISALGRPVDKAELAVSGVVTGVETCPPCPRGATCGKCPPERLVLSDPSGAPGELTVCGAPGGRSLLGSPLGVMGTYSADGAACSRSGPALIFKRLVQLPFPPMPSPSSGAR